MNNKQIINYRSDVVVKNKSYLKARNPIGSDSDLPTVLMITSYPPRECGIATYSNDLTKALRKQFGESFYIKICALETVSELHQYPAEVKYILNTDFPETFAKLTHEINKNSEIVMVIVQHEFGFYQHINNYFTSFLNEITKPISIVFHTVLPFPDLILKNKVQRICDSVSSIIVMTETSSSILINDYSINNDLITVIPHGTHLIPHSDKIALKRKYKLNGRKICATFGLIGPGKSIETSLKALPSVISKNPDILFLIIGKTHPSIVKNEGEKYRSKLEAIVQEFELENHVLFINQFLPLNELLEYLQLTDIYLFTSNDPNQAVSGTFSYAISCGCPVISTPIPHAIEVLKNESGIIIDFNNSEQLQIAINSLLENDGLRENISSNGLHLMAATCWENSAIKHAEIIHAFADFNFVLKYSLPEINLLHFKRLTTDFGMLQFSILNKPVLESGYTLDDNARALIACCQLYKIERNSEILSLITIYFNFIKYCSQPDGYFLNYVDKNKLFTKQNSDTNLEDSNGRAIWALGHIISIGGILPYYILEDAKRLFNKAIVVAHNFHSTRAMAFIIKGLYYSNLESISIDYLLLIKKLANRLVQMYRHESKENWTWFEGYLTYANSTLSEALLCAWLATGEIIYKDIAKSSFDFLLSKIIKDNKIQVISNKNWIDDNRSETKDFIGGQQPIDVAYTIITLNKFYKVFKREKYRKFIELSFNWFLGNNHLKQIIYNPCTGGCYDGIEENSVNLNQGAESTISYLMARLIMEQSLIEQKNELRYMELITSKHKSEIQIG
jgi:glycosyltransferase involved in cell wall biosynthesis